MREVTVRVPGSCGELIQGSVRGNDFLVSCPINLYSRVKVQLDSSIQGIEINQSVPRTLQAVKYLLDKLEIQKKGINITIDSDLINGVGMASSTADISAALAGLMLLSTGEVDLQLLKRIVVNIEPSDSVFLDGLHIFNHRRGSESRYLGEAPLMEIMLFKEPGQVDSLKFNQNRELDNLNYRKEKEVIKALRLLERGIKEKNCRLIGRAATISSLAHQQILHKKTLKNLIEIGEDYREIHGVNIAHSGTLIGVLTAEDFRDKDFKLEVKRVLPELEYITRVKMISGGIEMRVENERTAWRKLNQSRRTEWV